MLPTAAGEDRSQVSQGFHFVQKQPLNSRKEGRSLTVLRLNVISLHKRTSEHPRKTRGCYGKLERSAALLESASTRPGAAYPAIFYSSELDARAAKWQLEGEDCAVNPSILEEECFRVLLLRHHRHENNDGVIDQTIKVNSHGSMLTCMAPAQG
eukprot:3226564-Amphidinium_carterae.1